MARMTKRDFELIADTLRTSRNHDEITDWELEKLAIRFANKLADTNDRFDAKRFVERATRDY